MHSFTLDAQLTKADAYIPVLRAQLSENGHGKQL